MLKWQGSCFHPFNDVVHLRVVGVADADRVLLIVVLLLLLVTSAAEDFLPSCFNFCRGSSVMLPAVSVVVVEIHQWT